MSSLLSFAPLVPGVGCRLCRSPPAVSQTIERKPHASGDRSEALARMVLSGKTV